MAWVAKFGKIKEFGCYLPRQGWEAPRETEAEGDAYRVCPFDSGCDREVPRVVRRAEMQTGMTNSIRRPGEKLEGSDL